MKKVYPVEKLCFNSCPCEIYCMGLLKGYSGVGDIDSAGIYTSLIQEKIPAEEMDGEIFSGAQLIKLPVPVREYLFAGGGVQ